MANFYVDAAINANLLNQKIFGSGIPTLVRKNAVYTFSNNNLLVYD